MVECQGCGGEFTQLSQHWRLSDCSRPTFSERQEEILIGLMLGDGCLVRKEGRNPYFSASNTVKEFLEWFDDEMGVMGLGVHEHGEPEKDHHEQLYTCQTRTHPELEQFSEWYETEDRIPEIELTPLMAKCWYVSDGTILTPDDARPTARLTSRKSEGVKEDMRELFLYHGFKPTWSQMQLFFDSEDTRKLLDWMGESLPGFEYKFPEEPELENTYSMPDERQWEDKGEFQRLRYEKGMTYDEMAREWECSTATVHKWDRKHGFTP